MHRSRTGRRAGSPLRSWLAAVVLSITLCPALAAGQARPDTIPRDTVRRDTAVVAIPPIAVENDTLPQDSLLDTGDSLRVVPPFPRYPAPLPTGWAFARWEWDRTELQRFQAFSLLQLLERVPGLTLTRAGGYGAPTGVSALGLGGARLRVFLDGFELEPLGDATPDIQHVGLADLESVRVERDPGGVRVYLTSMRLEEARPVSVLEVGAGNYDVKLLRALLARGIGPRSIVTAAYDLLTTAGFGFAAPFSMNSARVAWSYALTPSTGLQLEVRNTAVERTTPALERDFSRRSLILRGRSELRPGLVLDALLSRTTFRPDSADPLDAELAATQAGVRASYDLGRGWLEGAARVRGADSRATALPELELSARGVLRPAPWLTAEAEGRSATSQGVAGSLLQGMLRAGPVGGLSAFGAVAVGRLPVGLVRDTLVPEVRTRTVNGQEVTDTISRRVPQFGAVGADAAGVRVGAEWQRGTGLLGAALVAAPAGPVAPFGLEFDRRFAAVDAEAASGVELRADLPLPRGGNALRLEGWYAHWLSGADRPYLPQSQGRVAAVLHNRFYDGHLEPTLRVEAVHRGASLVPRLDTNALVRVPGHQMLNLFLQIRILDLQAFLVLENLTALRGAQEVPGFERPGSNLLYGFRWIFRN